MATLERVTGKELPVEHHRRRAGDPAVLVAAPERARRVLGWLPQRSLEEMIADAALAQGLPVAATAL